MITLNAFRGRASHNHNPPAVSVLYFEAQKSQVGSKTGLLVCILDQSLGQVRPCRTIGHEQHVLTQCDGVQQGRVSVSAPYIIIRTYERKTASEMHVEPRIS